jgi:hypothetical protein
MKTGYRGSLSLFQSGENLRKSCMKRKNSLSVVMRSHHFLTEDLSSHSLTLRQMILQKEDEFCLFRRQPTGSELGAGSEKTDNRQTDNKRNQRRSSEADLIRWSGKCRENLKLLPVSASFGQ